ncbi:class I SAM-dependent methyltransferase [Acaryochloris sp. IP29b_bin.148]|uniref:class I SAM-dependent methyltransferase n=1 Tax=Acaryochloris sp. IP29b_bin.148 TaxID=2969218 RepID=UPI00260784F4|nr:class I SAM-dependent methyltransferase [Acaryochloris sp. IP29b_bin.148]
MVHTLGKYEIQNTSCNASEFDPYTVERYRQFYKHFPANANKVLDVGCNTGKGGLALYEMDASLSLSGLDCSQKRLNILPHCYTEGIYGLSNEIPTQDNSFDVIVAGEFLEHLYPIDVDRTICEFQRVLIVGGRLILTTPNPHYIKNKLTGTSVYTYISHLTQHFPRLLKSRLMMHGFSNVRIFGSGKVSRYLGSRFPFRFLYGSYLVAADKY